VKKLVYFGTAKGAYLSMELRKANVACMWEAVSLNRHYQTLAIVEI
jgi:hypothetical protein